ncbi:hypothetical protein BY996DRAFT_6487473 [Phakopsora pachyrhizi]|nr:hypothetical protein BY996DRAFT_6487473 [Phakopsora pachyrhizi]
MRADPDGPPGGWRRPFWEVRADDGRAGLELSTGAFESNLLGPFPGAFWLRDPELQRFACVGASLADPSASEIPGSERERGGSVGTKKIRRERKEWGGAYQHTLPSSVSWAGPRVGTLDIVVEAPLDG